MTNVIRFLGIELETDGGVLVPRAETELLGRTALALLPPPSDTVLRVIDMCCGAGNLACAIAAARADVRVFASDLTDACVALTRRNVARLGLGERVHVAQGDLFAGLADAGLEGAVDLVVCNPPYISTGRLAKESAHLLESEPREAFDGGPYGLSIHQRVMKEAPPFMRPGAHLAFEIGAGQRRQLDLLFGRARVFSELRAECDDAGEPRVVVARFTQTV